MNKFIQRYKEGLLDKRQGTEEKLVLAENNLKQWQEAKTNHEETLDEIDEALFLLGYQVEVEEE